MTAAQAFHAIQRVQLNALKAAGQTGLTQVLPFVPINTGTLRRSGEVIAEGNDVYIRFGVKDTGERSAKDYAAYQYSTAKRHYFTGSAMGRLLQLFTGDAKKAARAAKDPTRYGAAYKQVKDQLTTFPNGAQWFKVILRSKELQNKMARVYSRALRGGING